MSDTETSVPPCDHDHVNDLKQTVGEAPAPAGPLTCAIMKRLAEDFGEDGTPAAFARRYLDDPTDELCKADDPTLENVYHAYAVYDTVARAVARSLGGVEEYEMFVYTEPAPEDNDHTLVTFRGFVLFEVILRASARYWKSVTGMEADLARDYAAMRRRARTIIANEAKLKKMGLL